MSQLRFPGTRKGFAVKEITSWRGGRVASLIPNILPRADAAACIRPAGNECWCELQCDWCASCAGKIYCYTCYGRVREECTWCCSVC